MVFTRKLAAVGCGLALVAGPVTASAAPSAVSAQGPSLQKRVTNLEIAVAAQAKTVTQIQADITEIKGTEIPGLQNQITTTDGQLGTINGAISTISNQIAGLDARVKVLESATPTRIINGRSDGTNAITGDTSVSLHVANTGIYQVFFAMPSIANCTFQATAVIPADHATVAPPDAGTNSVTVTTVNSAGTPADSPYNVTGTCTK